LRRTFRIPIVQYAGWADIDARLTALTIVGMLRGTGCSRPLSERLEADYAAMVETLKKVMIRGLRPA
jgi:hypothetical protein